jgi:hypothetical protein
MRIYFIKYATPDRCGAVRLVKPTLGRAIADLRRELQVTDLKWQQVGKAEYERVLDLVRSGKGTVEEVGLE